MTELAVDIMSKVWSLSFYIGRIMNFIIIIPRYCDHSDLHRHQLLNEDISCQMQRQGYHDQSTGPRHHFPGQIITHIPRLLIPLIKIMTFSILNSPSTVALTSFQNANVSPTNYVNVSDSTLNRTFFHNRIFISNVFPELWVILTLLICSQLLPELRIYLGHLASHQLQSSPHLRAHLQKYFRLFRFLMNRLRLI